MFLRGIFLADIVEKIANIKIRKNSMPYGKPKPKTIPKTNPNPGPNPKLSFFRVRFRVSFLG